MEPIIRPATPADYESLCAVIEDTDAFHRVAVPRVFKKGDGPPRTREYIEGLIADPNIALLVAEVEGCIAGFVHVLLRESPPLSFFVPRRFAHVDTLGVAEAYRRRGIGRALMAAAEAWALEQGAQDIELQVYEFNEGAQALYRETGYKTTMRRMNKELR